MNRTQAVLATVVAFGVLGGAAYAADPETRTIQITGTVNDIVTLGEASIANNNNVTPGTNAATISTMADEDIKRKPFKFTISMDISTNYKAKLSLTSLNGALRNTAAPFNSGYTNYVEYTAEPTIVDSENNAIVAFLPALNADSSDGTSKTITSSEFSALSGKLNIAVETIGLGTNFQKKLMAGNYSDTLTIKVGSNL